MALSQDQRAARRAFVDIYGPEARDVVNYIARGWNTPRIADKVGIPVTSVAAYRANVTRGTYWPFVDADFNTGEVVGGSCNF